MGILFERRREDLSTPRGKFREEKAAKREEHAPCLNEA